MKAPKKILVPTDMSAYSLDALGYAQEVSKLFGAEIIVLRVLESDTRKAGLDRDRLSEEDLEVRRELIRLLLDRNVLTGSVRIEVRHGSPAREIVNAAKGLHADLIVMSTHGRTGLKHALLGSVAEKVVRHATIPVLTVKPDEFVELIEISEGDVTDNLHLSSWPEVPDIELEEHRSP
jgi:nucleotide-binding universal stress UspA family protein